MSIKRAVNVLCKLTLCASAVLAVPAQTTTFKTLYSFCAQDGCTDGANPFAGLIQATNGSFYGSTQDGGTYGVGTIFQLTPSGTLTTLYNFCSQQTCLPGFYPNGLVQATSGYLYGTTQDGGANGFGTVFAITPTGLTTLSNFTGGRGSSNSLVQGASGNLYGTTSGGASGGGTVFQITPTGTQSTLYNFCSQANCADGLYPYASLVQAYNGYLYGTTLQGGADSGGTVFVITPAGTLVTLYSFSGGNPFAGLVLASNGNMYGATQGGGANGAGTVFQITPGGTLTTLYSFCAQTNCSDGQNPFGGLVQASDGNLYGTTSGGGANGQGSIFKISSTGSLTTLYSFCSQTGCPDGATPESTLIQATNGALYGTTVSGGANGSGGVVFSLSVGLGPFVKVQPNIGVAGELVEIQGADLTGATKVTFGGVAAKFSLASSSLIAVTVPTGAPSGYVEVVTPSGTLKSNLPFEVWP
jgi:uncharacterized repeat protein (TIGR03803 family)